MSIGEVWKNDYYLKSFFGIFTNIELVSIDIFDTLVFRRVSHPMDLFEVIGKKCVEKGYLDEYFSEYKFKYLRFQAELDAIEKYGKDYVNIEEIYENFPFYVNHRKEIIKLELDLEKEYSYLNLSMYSFIQNLKARNLKVLLTSDIYWSKDQILDILHELGFDQTLVDDIYISSDNGCSKKTGRLFRKILKRFSAIPPHNMLHIGDNFNVDCIMARMNKMQYLHYNVIPDKKYDQYEVEKNYSDKNFASLLSLRKLASNLNPYIGTKFDVWYNIGTTILGPMLVSYCEYIADYVQCNNIKYIYPLMREGKIIGDILGMILKRRGYDVSISLLYTSRQAVLLPSLCYSYEKYIEAVLFGPMNVIELFKLLDLDVPSPIINAVANKGMYEISAYYRNQIYDVLNTNENRMFILNRARKEYTKFIRYLKKFSFDKNFMFIDIGFSGTVMRALNDILMKQNVRSNLFHNMLVFGGRKIENSGIRIDYVEKKDSLTDLMFDFMEEFLNSNEGSVERYIEENGEIIAKLKNNKVSRTQKKGIDICQMGIKNYCILYNQMHRTVKKLNVDNKIKDIYILFRRLVDLPSFSEKCVLDTIQHCNDYGINDYNYIACTDGYKEYINEYETIQRIVFLNSIRNVRNGISNRMLMKKIYQKYKRVYIYTFNKDLIEKICFIGIEILYILEKNRCLAEMYYNNILIKYLPDYINKLNAEIPIVIPEEVDNMYIESLKECGCRNLLIKLTD